VLIVDIKLIRYENSRRRGTLKCGFSWSTRISSYCTMVRTYTGSSHSI